MPSSIRKHTGRSKHLSSRSEQPHLMGEPVLYSKMDLATGQLVGVADFAIKPSARGVVRMRVFAIDTGEMETLSSFNMGERPPKGRS